MIFFFKKGTLQFHGHQPFYDVINYVIFHRGINGGALWRLRFRIVIFPSFFWF